MKKDLSIIFGLFTLILFIVVFGKNFSSVSFGGGHSLAPNSKSTKESTKVVIRDYIIDAKVANTNKERQKGLSDRDSLPIGSGMLFVFDKSGVYPIWMKDMKFAIDIIWIDSSKKIVDIVESAPPEPGMDDNELTIYRPNSEAKYILEMNAGMTKLHTLEIGDAADFGL
jgi:hypothetical protein